MSNKSIKEMFDNKINKQNNYNELLRKREYMKKNNLIKVFIPTCSLMLVIVAVVLLNLNNSSYNLKEYTENNNEIVINEIKNSNSGLTKLDVDVKIVNDIEVQNEFEFLKDINSKYNYKNSYAYYIREDINADEYSILKDYVYEYDEFTLVFSKIDKPLRDYFFDGETTLSKINNIDAEIIKYNDMYFVQFETNNTYFDIETKSNSLSEKQLIELIEILTK